MIACPPPMNAPQMLQWGKNRQWHSSNLKNLVVPSSCPRSAVELHAAPALVMAAPILLVIWPALHPIGEASTTVIDSAFRVSNTFCKNMSVKVIAAVPGSWASHVSVVTAPGLLVCRPSKIPVGVAFMAIVLKDMRFVVNHLRPVHNMRWRWYWEILEMGSRWHRNWLVHLVDDKGSLVMTCSLMLSTAIVLLTRIPQGLPGMIPIVASGPHEMLFPNVPVLLLANGRWLYGFRSVLNIPEPKCSRQQLYGSPLPGSSAALEDWFMYTARSIPRMLQHTKTARIKIFKIKYPFMWASLSLMPTPRFQAALWNGWKFTMALCCTYSWRCQAAQDDNGSYCHQAVAAYGAPQLLTVLAALFAKVFALPRAALPNIPLFLLQINVAATWKVEKHVEMKIMMRHAIYWNRGTLYQLGYTISSISLCTVLMCHLHHLRNSKCRYLIMS